MTDRRRDRHRANDLRVETTINRREKGLRAGMMYSRREKGPRAEMILNRESDQGVETMNNTT